MESGISQVVISKKLCSQFLISRVKDISLWKELRSRESCSDHCWSRSMCKTVIDVSEPEDDLLWVFGKLQNPKLQTVHEHVSNEGGEGPLVGRPERNWKVFSSKKQMFILVHNRMSFSNSSAASKEIPALTRSSYSVSTATLTGMFVNIKRTLKETSLQLLVNRRSSSAWANWLEFYIPWIGLKPMMLLK